MEKIESLNSTPDSKSYRLFECYRIALDFGLDAGNNAAENLIVEDQALDHDEASSNSSILG